MNSKVYKCCAVPQCDSTSIKTPKKLFVYVPHNKIVRNKWLNLARRDPTEICQNSRLYFCEDHFDLSTDMANFMEYHVTGSVSQVRMNPGCVPRKFDCQLVGKKRPGGRLILNKQRKTLTEESDKDLGGRRFNTKHFKLGQTSSESSVTESSEVKSSFPSIASTVNDVSITSCPEIYDQNYRTPTPTTQARPHDSENVAIKWKYYDMNVRSHFQSLLHNEQYVDVKLSAEGRIIKCHKVILSSFSSYFDEVFRDTPPGHIPVIFLKGVPFWILELLVEYMYVGEFIIEEEKLPQIFSVATELKIRGLEQQDTFSTSKSSVPDASMTRQGDFRMSCSESESDAAPSAQRYRGEENVTFSKRVKLTPNSRASPTPYNPVNQTTETEQIIISPTIITTVKSEPPDFETEDTKVIVVPSAVSKQDPTNESYYVRNSPIDADKFENHAPPGLGNYIT